MLSESAFQEKRKYLCDNNFDNDFEFELMLARVKLLFLPKAVQWKFCRVSKYYLRRGYRANLNNNVYFKLAKQIVCKVETLVPLQINVYRGETLPFDKSEQASILSWLREIISVVIRIIVITTIVLGLLTFYWVDRCLSSKLHSTIYLRGIEFLGPTFIKFGQWMSMRKDLYPEEVCSTLSRLQRNASPHSWQHTENVLKTTYGPSWRQTFVEFDPVPVGSGCCAQVYRALIRVNYYSTRDVRQIIALDERTSQLIPVAVKILHPRIRERLNLDLSVLQFLSKCVTCIVPSYEWLSITDCINEFSQIMEKQVDMRTEAENLKTFSRNFAAIPDVRFPEPFCNLSNDQILVETFYEGNWIGDYLHRNDEALRHILARIGVYTVFKMIFEDNFVHCDLHPGNILVQENSVAFNLLQDPRIVILDCGLVTELSDRCLDNLREVFRFVVAGDGRKIADSMMKHSVSDCPDPEGFRAAIDLIVKRHLQKGVRLDKINVAQVISELFAAMVRYRVKNDGSFTSVILSIAVIESLGRSLDPGIDLIYEVMPFLINNGFVKL